MEIQRVFPLGDTMRDMWRRKLFKRMSNEIIELDMLYLRWNTEDFACGIINHEKNTEKHAWDFTTLKNKSNIVKRFPSWEHWRFPCVVWYCKTRKTCCNFLSHFATWRKISNDRFCESHCVTTTNLTIKVNL